MSEDRAPSSGTQTGPAGIIGYSSYLPWYRLDRAEITKVLGEKHGGGKGARSVAAFDEDTTTMGVAAGRRALLDADAEVDTLWFATTWPAYSDKTNATIIHSAMGLPEQCFAADLTGSVRNGGAALRAAWSDARNGATSLAITSDIRTGLPASQDERDGGDAAAAFLFGTGDRVLAEVLSWASVTEEFLDRWRRPGDSASRVWEERFGFTRYPELMETVAKRAVADAGITPDHVVVSSPHGRSVKAVAKAFPREVVAPGFASEVGYAGTADAGLMLTDVLDRAEPGQTILVVLGADGADAIVLRTTSALPEFRAMRAGPTVREQLAVRGDVAYADFLSWRGMLHKEPPRRPDVVPPSAPAAARSTSWKFALTGSRCTECKTMHLPPQHVCMSCGSVKHMEPERVDRTTATIATFAIDHLDWSPAPPIVSAVVDFEGGGRFQCDMADALPDDVQVGDTVEMTFRRLSSSTNAIHNYFWKARSVRRGNAHHGQ